MTIIESDYEKILNNAAAVLDIPPSKYQQAVERYEAVGAHLESGTYSECDNREPQVFPQGSFRLGTVVRPLIEGKESDYDIDLVCKLFKRKTAGSRKTAKSEVGDRLKENHKYEQILKPEGKRCWTLQYAEEDGIGFHIDVLPAVLEDQSLIDRLVELDVSPDYAQHAVGITNKEPDGSYTWKSSNPEGFALWFHGRMKTIIEFSEASERERIFKANTTVFDSVESVPPQLVRTPLQRAIQIMKRHRDMRFAGKENEDAKPISMVITTLAAQLYRDEMALVDTLRNIITRIQLHADQLRPDWWQKSAGFSESMRADGGPILERKSDGMWYLPNPVNPEENFADRWHEDGQRKAKAFFHWVDLVKADFIGALETGKPELIEKALKGGLGTKVFDAVVKSIAPTSVLLSVPEPSTIITSFPKPWAR